MAAQPAEMDPAKLSELPSVPAPPGWTSDLDGPNPLKTTIITVTTVFMGLAFLFMGIRAYTKIKIKGRWTWDDVTCVLGLISTLVYWIVFLLQVQREGFGRHFWNVPLTISLSDAWLKLNYLSECFTNIAFTFVKVTFFIFYWSIFKPFRWLNYGIVSGAVVVVGVYIACTLILMIKGAPSPGQTWHEVSSDSRLFIGEKLTVPLAAWSVASDVFILILPISGMLRLQLSPRKRIALLMVVLTGLGACICSSLSLYYRTTLSDEDFTYTIVNLKLLTVVELCVGICITCLPTTSLFLQYILPPVNTSLRARLGFYIKKDGRRSSPLTPGPGASRGSRSGRSDGVIIEGPYRNLTDSGGLLVGGGGKRDQYDLGLYSTSNVKTNVIAEPFEHIDNDDEGIHLRVDMEQN